MGGTVLETYRKGKEGAHFEWRIEGWWQWRGKWIISPEFSFVGTNWWMELIFLTDRTDAYIRRSLATHEPVRCWLGMRRADGGQEEFGSRTREPGNSKAPCWTLPVLESREAQLAPSGTLTLLIRMSTGEETETEKLKKEIASYQQQLEKNTESSAKLKQQNKELETKLNSVQNELRDLQKQHDSSMLEFWKTKREIEVLEQQKNDLVKQLEERRGDIEQSKALKDSCATCEAQQYQRISDFSDLQEHFKKLLSADDHDVLLKVQTKEFRVHKNVLRARSPVFEAMFKHGMKEDVENTVDIADCDPNCFGQFLEYVYTGQVEDLSPVNAPSLYFCGDKYGFNGLKRKCVDLLQSSLSVPLVSDVITLAVTHGEEELLESAMDYVTQYLDEVMESVEWQRFAISNPIQANEVCLKAVKRIRSNIRK